MQTLNRHFRDLTRAAFSRYGFAYADILAQWGAIVGPDLARCCSPERISWPRSCGENERRQGGTLVVRAAPGRALDLQYEAPRIVERLNAFYGYAAVGQIRIKQGTGGDFTAPREAPGVIDPEAAVRIETHLAPIADPDLRGALRRLGLGIAARAAPAADPSPLNQQRQDP